MQLFNLTIMKIWFTITFSRLKLSFNIDKMEDMMTVLWNSSIKLCKKWISKFRPSRTKFSNKLKKRILSYLNQWWQMFSKNHMIKLGWILDKTWNYQKQFRLKNKKKFKKKNTNPRSSNIQLLRLVEKFQKMFSLIVKSKFKADL